MFSDRLRSNPAKHFEETETKKYFAEFSYAWDISERESVLINF